MVPPVPPLRTTNRRHSDHARSTHSAREPLTAQPGTRESRGSMVSGSRARAYRPECDGSRVGHHEGDGSIRTTRLTTTITLPAGSPWPQHEATSGSRKSIDTGGS